jgi:hypothetical protein
MYTGSASNYLARRERATFRNGWLHKWIAQSHPTNCGLGWQYCFLPPSFQKANDFWIYHIQNATFMSPNQLKVVIFKHLQWHPWKA